MPEPCPENNCAPAISRTEEKVLQVAVGPGQHKSLTALRVCALGPAFFCLVQAGAPDVDGRLSGVFFLGVRAVLRPF